MSDGKDVIDSWEKKIRKEVRGTFREFNKQLSSEITTKMIRIILFAMKMNNMREVEGTKKYYMKYFDKYYTPPREGITPWSSYATLIARYSNNNNLNAVNDVAPVKCFDQLDGYRPHRFRITDKWWNELQK